MLGELISLGVAFSWTATAIFSEVASKRMGSLPLNVIRMLLSLSMLAVTLWLTLGSPYPIMADGQTWLWLSLSGFVGYALGDYCLFQSYILIGSRFGQLFMTLASPAAALTAWALLDEQMSPLATLGMIITMIGIGMSVLNKKAPSNASVQTSRSIFSLKLPTKGILFAIGASLGQGIGLVLSKVGMEHYTAALVSNGIQDLSAWSNPDAFCPISLEMMMPFASTMIRGITGLAGFSFALFCLSHNGKRRLQSAVSNRKGLLCAVLAAIFGPFVGVSLSLMATLYTNTGIAQTIMSMTPVLIILPSWLFFKQKITLWEVVGAFICVFGVALFFI